MRVQRNSVFRISTSNHRFKGREIGQGVLYPLLDGLLSNVKHGRASILSQ